MQLLSVLVMILLLTITTSLNATTSQKNYDDKAIVFENLTTELVIETQMNVEPVSNNIITSMIVVKNNIEAEKNTNSGTDVSIYTATPLRNDVMMMKSICENNTTETANLRSHCVTNERNMQVMKIGTTSPVENIVTTTTANNDNYDALTAITQWKSNAAIENDVLITETTNFSIADATNERNIAVMKIPTSATEDIVTTATPTTANNDTEDGNAILTQWKSNAAMENMDVLITETTDIQSSADATNERNLQVMKIPTSATEDIVTTTPALAAAVMKNMDIQDDTEALTNMWTTQAENLCMNKSMMQSDGTMMKAIDPVMICCNENAITSNDVQDAKVTEMTQWKSTTVSKENTDVRNSLLTNVWTNNLMMQNRLKVNYSGRNVA